MRQAITRAESVRVRNALNPLLWLTAVVTPVSLAFAWVAGVGTTTAAILVALAILPPLSVVAAFFICLFRFPDRLQSEEYLLRRDELLILSKNGRQDDPSAMDIVGNPALDRPDGNGENAP